MILRLIELRTAKESAERREDYRHAIDRLDALAYRLKAAAAPGWVIGMPKKPSPLTAKPLQAPLPLGPVIVRPANRGAKMFCVAAAAPACTRRMQVVLQVRTLRGKLERTHDPSPMRERLLVGLDGEARRRQPFVNFLPRRSVR